MNDLYTVSRFLVQFLGPLLVVCIVMMYFMVAKRTGREPRLKEVVYQYARYNLDRRRHAGLLTYLLMVGSFFFVLSVIGLVAGYLLR